MLSHTTSSIFASFPYLAVVREIRYRLVAILNKKSRKLLKGRLSQTGQKYRRAKEGAAKVTPANLTHKGLIRPGSSLFVLSDSENLINRNPGFRESRIPEAQFPTARPLEIVIWNSEPSDIVTTRPLSSLGTPVSSKLLTSVM